MLERYTAVDVETPNRNNDSICAIGVVRMAYGVPVSRRGYLVNPRVHFDDFNVGIHGITPDMVRDAPVFPEVWREIAPCFSGVTAAHSASFDLGVICKSLALWNLPIPEISFVCSLRKARRHLPREARGSCRLDALCARFGVPLDHHHDALSDALGCALVLKRLMDEFGADASDIRKYSFKGVAREVAPRERDEAVRQLRAVLERFGRGARLSEECHRALEDWERRNDRFLRDPDVRACHDFVDAALLRGSIGAGEHGAGP